MAATKNTTRTAGEPMPWGVIVYGDKTTCWADPAKGPQLGVLRRPIGPRNACEAGETVSIKTDGHIVALVDGQGVAVKLRRGEVKK